MKLSFTQLLKISFYCAILAASQGYSQTLEESHFDDIEFEFEADARHCHSRHSDSCHRLNPCDLDHHRSFRFRVIDELANAWQANAIYLKEALEVVAKSGLSDPEIVPISANLTDISTRINELVTKLDPDIGTTPGGLTVFDLIQGQNSNATAIVTDLKFFPFLVDEQIRLLRENNAQLFALIGQDMDHKHRERFRRALDRYTENIIQAAFDFYAVFLNPQAPEYTQAYQTFNLMLINSRLVGRSIAFGLQCSRHHHHSSSSSSSSSSD